MQENLLSLDVVKSHFEHWRATRTKMREKIPQQLFGSQVASRIQETANSFVLFESSEDLIA